MTCQCYSSQVDRQQYVTPVNSRCILACHTLRSRAHDQRHRIQQVIQDHCKLPKQCRTGSFPNSVDPYVHGISQHESNTYTLAHTAQLVWIQSTVDLNQGIYKKDSCAFNQTNIITMIRDQNTSRFMLLQLTRAIDWFASVCELLPISETNGELILGRGTYISADGPPLGGWQNVDTAYE